MQARVKEDQTFKPFTIELTVENKREVEFLYYLFLSGSKDTVELLNKNINIVGLKSNPFLPSEIDSLKDQHLIPILSDKL